MKKCSNPNCTEASNSVTGNFCGKCGAPTVEALKMQETPIIRTDKTNKAILFSLIVIIGLLSAGITILLVKPLTSGGEADATAEAVKPAQIITVAGTTTEAKSFVDEENGVVTKVDSIVAKPENAALETEPLITPTPQPEKPDTPINLEIVQVDSAGFPYVKLYVNITDMYGDIVQNISGGQLEIFETDAKGSIVPALVDEVRRSLVSDKLNINMVLDISGSMASSNKMGQAKQAATSFLSQLEVTSNDLVEITAFDSYVYTSATFSNDYNSLVNTINALSPGSSTALYDAMYSALLRTSSQDGAKCVIVFTDGLENGSSYTYSDVINLAASTGIPLYIIGIGGQCDVVALTNLADMTNGEYFEAREVNLGEVLMQIYTDVYRMQRERYLVEFTSVIGDFPEQTRQIRLAAKSGGGFEGEYVRDYVPVPILNQYFSDKYKDKDYMLDFSSSRAVKTSDLSGMSLAELRIARNEIFARHGRQFKDPLLNKWFYSKPWYLQIAPKYSPQEFDSKPSPLSKLELANIDVIVEFERYIMEHERIFPNSSNTMLTEYDVSLSKPVLERGLEEIYSSANASVGDKSRFNQIERSNAELIESALAQPDVTY